MADRKISDLTALTTPASGDYLPIVDISEAAAASKNKRITIEELMRGVPDGTAAAPGIAFETDPNTGIYRPGADQLAVATNGTGRLFIDASGRVGVGTASPVAQLQSSVTDGTISIASAGTTKALRIIHDSTTTGIEGVDTTLSASYQPLAIGGSYLVFATEGAERLRITSAGLVGIGNSAPLSKLDVQTAVDGLATIARFYNLSNVSAATESAIDLQADQSASRISNLRDGAGTFGTTIISNTAAGVMGERLRITSAGLVGIGTSSVGARLHIRDGSNVNLYGAANGAAFQWTAVNDSASAYIDYIQNALTVQFQTGGSERARIDSSGRLLVGTSSSSGLIRAAFQANTGNSAGAGVVHLQRGEAAAAITVDEILGSLRGTDNADNIGAEINFVADATWGSGDYPGRLVFSTTADGASSPTERMRITQSGHTSLIASNNVFYVGSSGTAGTAETIYQGAHSATIGTSFSGTVSFSVFTNGNVQNTNNSYTAISDIKLKENIVDANSQWDDLKSLRVRNYNLKEGQTHTQIGLVAQEVEPISPGLVYEFPDRDEDGNDLGTVTKSVNYSVLYMKAVKALQEAMERIESLEAKVAALEAQ
jgi:hypothetical protein